MFPTLYNQKVDQTVKMKTCCSNKGRYAYKLKLNQDVFFPRESLKLELDLDITESKINLETVTCELCRHVDVLNPKRNKVSYKNEKVIIKEEYVPFCKNGTASKLFEFYIPDNIFYPEETEKPLMPKIGINDKHMEKGISSSINTQIYKVSYSINLNIKSAKWMS